MTDLPEAARTDAELCDHKWKWIRDLYGDPCVYNYWVCEICGQEDGDEDPPDYSDDWEY